MPFSFSMHFAFTPAALLWWAHWWPLALPLIATLLFVSVHTGWVFFRYYWTDDLPYGFHAIFETGADYVKQQLVANSIYLLFAALSAGVFVVLPAPFWLWGPVLVVVGLGSYICRYTEGASWLGLLLSGLIPAVTGVCLPYSLYFGQLCTPSPAFIVLACTCFCYWLGTNALLAFVHVLHVASIRHANRLVRPLFEKSNSPST